MKNAILAVLFVILIPAISNAGNDTYVDGVYEGECSFVKVRVAIKDGNISDVKILRHGGGGEKYADMINPLTDKVVQEQSTNIDAITGATVSSKNFKKAVDNALKKALLNSGWDPKDVDTALRK